jgi:hypothetical protein
MATVYSAPKGFEFPNYDISLSHEENRQKEDEATAKLKEFCREQSNCPHAGEVIGFPIADGKAMYMILDYKRLIHMPVGDAWSIPDAHARGLRKADLIHEVDRGKSLAALFARSEK